MSGILPKPVIDQILKSSTDISKHHADQMLEIISEELTTQAAEHNKSVDSLVELVESIDETQNSFKSEVEGLIVKLSESHRVMQDLINTGNDTANKNFGNSAEEIDLLKAAIGELSDIVESDDALVQLKSSVVELDKKLDNEALETITTFEGVEHDVKQVTEYLNSVVDDLATSDAAVSERIDDLAGQVKASVGNLKRAAVISDKENEKSLKKVLTDIGKAEKKISNLKANIVGYGDDLATLSTFVHGNVDDLEKADVEINESLIDVHRLIAAAESNNETLRSNLDAIATSLSKQFTELKNESFLSNDKIDTKFAEIKLSLVESDIIRDSHFKESIEHLGDELGKDLEVSFKEYRRHLVTQVEASNQIAVDNVDKLLATDKKLLSRAKQWVPGVEYGENIVARNLGGLWQANAKTTDAPTAESKDWYCLSSSFYKLSVIKEHPNGVETTVGFHDSLGNIHELTVPGSNVRYLKGVYQSHVPYDQLDSIMKDGCRWVATKDEPQGVPGDDNADWQVLTMRGPKGFSGKKGDPGAQGKQGEQGKRGERGLPGPSPDMDSIVKALVDFESGDDGQAIRRSRGLWKLGEDYTSGDVVTVGKGLFLCLRNNNGLDTPGSSTEDWLLLIQASGGVGSGGGSDIEVIDESTPLTTGVTKFTFAGTGVTTTAPVADEVLVTIPGGSNPPSFDIESLPAEITSVVNNYPVNVDTVEVDELQVRLQVDRPAGQYIVNWHTHHNIGAVNNSVLTRYSTDGGSTWHESSRESKDVTDEIEKYIAFPLVHAGGALDIVLQMRKELAANTLVIRNAEVWLDAKFSTPWSGEEFVQWS